MIKTSNLTKNSEKRQNFDFEIWRSENRNIFKTNNIFNTIHFWFIVATLKCVRLILQFHRFINMCAKWKIVIENAMKIDVFEFLRLMFRSRKNFLIRKNEFFFIKSFLYRKKDTRCCRFCFAISTIYVCQILRFFCERLYNQNSIFCRHVEFWNQFFEFERVVWRFFSRMFFHFFYWINVNFFFRYHRDSKRVQTFDRIRNQRNLRIIV